jgi:hypothetical protein
MWACPQAFLKKCFARNFFLLCYFKMFAIVDVKLSRIWGERINVREGESSTCIINLPIASHESAKNKANFPTLEV